jgi:hypothetical protein
MLFMQTLDDLLGHICQVESETVEQSREAYLRMHAFIEREGLVPDDATLEAMQYQDIVSQQLGATIEAIGSLRECLKEVCTTAEPSVADRSVERLAATLEQARERHAGFGGKRHHDDDAGIEFF